MIDNICLYFFQLKDSWEKTNLLSKGRLSLQCLDGHPAHFGGDHKLENILNHLFLWLETSK